MTDLTDDGLEGNHGALSEDRIRLICPFISRWVTLPSLHPFSGIYSITHSLLPLMPASTSTRQHSQGRYGRAVEWSGVEWSGEERRVVMAEAAAIS